MEKEFVINVLRNFKKLDKDFDVYIIADVEKKTIKENNQIKEHANESEFFSRKEFSEIASAIFNVFGFVKVFYSELEFIKYILEKDIKNDECIVYNFARDGIKVGKKSLIPSFCDLLNIKYTGSNAFTISLLREKYLFSLYLSTHKITIPKTYKYMKNKGFVYNKPDNNTKLIVKYINESASMGIDENNIISYKNLNESTNLINDLAVKMNSNELLIQEYIDGIECEVFVFEYDNSFHALDPIGININNSCIINSTISNTYNYDFYLLENSIDKNICEEIKYCAEKVALYLGINNYARFDFRIDKRNKFYLIDIAGTPYTIQHSSIAFLFTNIYHLEYNDIYKMVVSSLISK